MHLRMQHKSGSGLHCLLPQALSRGRGPALIMVEAASKAARADCPNALSITAGGTASAAYAKRNHIEQCTLMQDHFLDILPEGRVEAVNAMYTAEAEEQLLGGQPDFVLDAIDNIETKVALLAACRRRGIPVLCSAGAGEAPVLCSSR